MTKLSCDPHNPYPLAQLGIEPVGNGTCDDRISSQIYKRLNITPEQLANLCEKWQISELALFGSVLRDDFRIDGEKPSDIDILFTYKLDANMSLLRRASMKIELERLIGRKVDVVMAMEVIESHNLIRKKSILDSARVIYVKR